MRGLPEAVQAGKAVAEALLRAMPQEVLRTHGRRTFTCTGPSTAVSQTVKTETGSTMSDAEQKRILDDMLKQRLDGRGETGSEAEAIQQILALVANLPDDASMIVKPDGTSVDARTIRVWASFYRTPERKQ